MASHDFVCYNAIKPCQKLPVDSYSTKQTTNRVNDAWNMDFDSEKITKPCDLFWRVLGVLKLVLDCNAFLSVPAMYWNHSKALN